MCIFNFTKFRGRKHFVAQIKMPKHEHQKRKGAFLSRHGCVQFSGCRIKNLDSWLCLPALPPLNSVCNAGETVQPL